MAGRTISRTNSVKQKPAKKTIQEETEEMKKAFSSAEWLSSFYGNENLLEAFRKALKNEHIPFDDVKAIRKYYFKYYQGVMKRVAEADPMLHLKTGREKLIRYDDHLEIERSKKDQKSGKSNKRSKTWDRLLSAMPRKLIIINRSKEPEIEKEGKKSVVKIVVKLFERTFSKSNKNDQISLELKVELGAAEVASLAWLEGRPILVEGGEKVQHVDYVLDVIQRLQKVTPKHGGYNEIRSRAYSLWRRPGFPGLSF